MRQKTKAGSIILIQVLTWLATVRILSLEVGSYFLQLFLRTTRDGPIDVGGQSSSYLLRREHSGVARRTKDDNIVLSSMMMFARGSWHFVMSFLWIGILFMQGLSQQLFF